MRSLKTAGFAQCTVISRAEDAKGYSDFNNPSGIMTENVENKIPGEV